MMLDAWSKPAIPLNYQECDGWIRHGTVQHIEPRSIVVRIRGVAPGNVIAIQTQRGAICFAEIRSVQSDEAWCAPLGPLHDVTVGVPATATRAELGSFCGQGLLGRCVDAWGGPEHPNCFVAAARTHSLALARRRPIQRELHTGVAAIDALCTIGIGQRVALFSGAGVGKSTLLQHMARHARLDAHVVALIGERGREAAETVCALRETPRWPMTTVICATADAAAHERLAAGRTALAQAEWLCEQGYDVLLTVDSLTRVANAWRELALNAGEPPAHRGHPASMVGTLAAIVERAGMRERGSITGIFAVLVDADDPFEPVTDAVRGLLDGHIVLSRRLADAGRYPPIDVLRSTSRIMNQIVSRERLADAARVRKAIAALERAEDLFAIGAYVPGGDLELDAAVEQRQRIERFIFHERDGRSETVADLAEIARDLTADRRA